MLQLQALNYLLPYAENNPIVLSHPAINKLDLVFFPKV